MMSGRPPSLGGTFVLVAVAGIVLLPSALNVAPPASAAAPYGDADCSDSVNAIDALLVFQRHAGFISGFSCPSALDPNADGFWDSRDALLILQFEAGFVAELGPLEYTLRITSGAAAVGQTVRVDVDLPGVLEPGLGGWTIDVTYDPAVVDLESCDPVQSGAICLPAFGKNTIRLSGESTQGLVGDVRLGSLGFQCVADGESRLDLNLQVFTEATDSPPRQVNVAYVHGRITCSS